MNKMKICLFVIFLILNNIFGTKSVAYTTNYTDKNISIEVIENTNKIKLTLVNRENVIINTLFFNNDLLCIKKGKIIKTTKLQSGFSSNVFASLFINKFQFYTILPSLSDNLFGASGIKYLGDNFTVDFEIFDALKIDNLITSDNYFVFNNCLRDMKKGLVSIVEIKSKYLYIRSEYAATTKGFYFSDSIILIYHNLKLNFEHQNLNYKYNFGINLKVDDIKFSIKEKIYFNSPFSGEGTMRDFLISGTLVNHLNLDLLFNYKLKSIKFNYSECVSFDEILNRTHKFDFYFIFILIRDRVDLINFKLGYKNKSLIFEIKINGIRFGYNNKKYYSLFELKNVINNLSIKFTYKFKKKFEINLKYSW